MGKNGEKLGKLGEEGGCKRKEEKIGKTYGGISGREVGKGKGYRQQREVRRNFERVSG